MIMENGLVDLVKLHGSYCIIQSRFQLPEL